MNKQVSVIIPAYNCAKYIRACLNSALNQTYTNLEVIVIDDGSTDDTKEAAVSFGDRIRYAYQPNRGVSAARNQGIKMAQGDYIAFLDADDVWTADKISEQVAFLALHPDIGVALTDMEFISEDGRSTGFYKRREAYPHDGMILPDVMIRPFPFPSTVLIRKNVLDGVGGFNENLRRSEDAEWFLRVAMKYKVGLIEKPLTQYRDVGNSLTTNMQVYETRICVLNDFFRQHPKVVSQYPDAAKQSLYKAYRDYGKDLLHQGQCVEARRQFLQAGKYQKNTECLGFIMKSYLKPLMNGGRR